SARGRGGGRHIVDINMPIERGIHRRAKRDGDAMMIERFPRKSEVSADANTAAAEPSRAFRSARREKEPGIVLAKAQLRPHHVQACAESKARVDTNGEGRI